MLSERPLMVSVNLAVFKSVTGLSISRALLLFYELGDDFQESLLLMKVAGFLSHSSDTRHHPSSSPHSSWELLLEGSFPSLVAFYPLFPLPGTIPLVDEKINPTEGLGWSEKGSLKCTEQMVAWKLQLQLTRSSFPPPLFNHIQTLSLFLLLSAYI